jgi:hypothetical protein
MGRVRASARKEIDAAPDAVYEVLTDYATHHPRIMPPSYFSDLEVESGGVGAGTVFRITLRVPGRDQRLHMKVDEPTPGRVLTETNLDTGVVTRFSVEPVGGGERTMAAMSSDMPTGAGLRGLVDRWMLPRMTKHIFEQQLEQLARYMRSRDAPT